MDNSTIIESKIIVLNSKDGDKLNGEYLSRIKFNFKDILKKEDDIYYVGATLLTAEIPCSFYNINVNNQTLKYTVNSTTYTITIPEGNYNATNFISQFIYLYNSGGHGNTISMSFNKITGKLTTTRTGGTYSTTYLASGSSMFEVLGLLENTDYTFSTSLENSYMMNLLGVKKLKVFLNNLSLENYDSKGHTSGSLLHTVSVDKPAYSMINYQNQNSALSRVKNKVINEIEIEIRDENNKLIDFNNIYWDMTILLNIYRKYTPPTNESLNLNVLAINPVMPENNPLPTKKEIKEVLRKIDEDNLKELELLSL